MYSGLRIKLCPPVQHVGDTRMELVWCSGSLHNLNHLLRHGRATKRLLTSPATIPLTPPSGLVITVS